MRTHPIPQTSSKEEALEGLVERTLRGDERAWHELWLALDPIVESVARRWRVASRLSRCPEGRRDIVVRVMGELREDGFRRLTELGERLACRDGSFRPWLRTVARNAAVSQMRAHPEYLGAVEGGAARWARHVPLPEALEDHRDPTSRRIEARRLLARAQEVLDSRQLDALCRWLQGESFAEIASALGEDGGADAAALLVKSAVVRLRSQFAVSRSSRGAARRRARSQ